MVETDVESDAAEDAASTYTGGAEGDVEETLYYQKSICITKKAFEVDFLHPHANAPR